MKTLFQIVLCLVLALVSASAEMRTFVSNSGKAMKAEIVSHLDGKVKIKREDGKEFEVDPTIFCKEDQKFIASWMEKNQEAVDYRFTLDADKKVIDRTGDSTSSYTKWAYEISITNTSQDPVNNLKIQYRVLYYSYSDKMIEGEALLKQDLKFNRTLVVTTIPVSIYKSKYSSSRGGELKGCLVRILDSEGNVIEDWVSKEVGMKGKTWKNTEPRKDGTHGGSAVIK